MAWIVKEQQPIDQVETVDHLDYTLYKPDPNTIIQPLSTKVGSWIRMKKAYAIVIGFAELLF
ncbi:hypothetical protein FVEN_g12803 [Fusarium venenatum]|nr:hypothetical protein FVEN_g12803 [Fusarium venenatum]